MALPPQDRVLRRSAEDFYLLGVCGGLGRYFSVDPGAVRLLALVLAPVAWLPYMLAPLVGYSAMFVVWVAIWGTLAALYARLSQGHAALPAAPGRAAGRRARASNAPYASARKVTGNPRWRAGGCAWIRRAPPRTASQLVPRGRPATSRAAVLNFQQGSSSQPAIRRLPVFHPANSTLSGWRRTCAGPAGTIGAAQPGPAPSTERTRERSSA